MTMAALITGGGSGIGRAIALTLARAKIPVIVNDIVQDAGEGTVKEIQDAGGEGLFVRADVSDSTQVKAMFGKIQKKYGKVDILVNNAGIPGPFTPLTQISDKNWHKTINVHLNGTFFCLYVPHYGGLGGCGIFPGQCRVSGVFCLQSLR